MCLGEVGKVLELAGTCAVVESSGRRVEVSLLTLDARVSPGDWILHHCGFALARLDPDEARDARGLRDVLGGPSDG